MPENTSQKAPEQRSISMENRQIYKINAAQTNNLLTMLLLCLNSELGLQNETNIVCALHTFFNQVLIKLNT